jgi:hypothetical protein
VFAAAVPRAWGSPTSSYRSIRHVHAHTHTHTHTLESSSVLEAGGAVAVVGGDVGWEPSICDGVLQHPHTRTHIHTRTNTLTHAHTIGFPPGGGGGAGDAYTQANHVKSPVFASSTLRRLDSMLRPLDSLDQAWLQATRLHPIFLRKVSTSQPPTHPPTHPPTYHTHHTCTTPTTQTPVLLQRTRLHSTASCSAAHLKSLCHRKEEEEEEDLNRKEEEEDFVVHYQT